MDFLPEDERYKYFDDASFIEVVNLLLAGLSCFNPKTSVPSDILHDKLFLPTDNTSTQGSLNTLSQWTDNNQMLLNNSKTKYMILNFCNSLQFNTRLFLDGSLLD